MNRLLLLVCMLIGFGSPALAQSGSGQPLVVNGAAVEFAFWQPEDPHFAYADLSLTPERRAAIDAGDAAVIEPLFRSDLHLRADGGVVETRVVTRLLTSPSAVRDAGNLAFWVDAYSQRAIIRQAYTLLPDGRRIEVDPATLQVLPDTNDDIFTDSYQIVVPFSGLEVDAIVVLVTETERKAGVWPLPWSRIYFPRAFRPREAFEVSVRWETGGIVPQWRSDLDALDCRKDGARAVRCTARQITAYPRDRDIAYRDVLPTLVISEKTTWQGLGLLVRSLFDPALMQDDGLEDLLARLLAGATSMDERLARIHRFVAQEIRYVGLEAGLGGIVPRPVATTLRRRFGDCKDKTALFVALARHVGLEAYPVLTTFDRFDADKLLLPAASYFDHMIACVVLPDGSERCYDLTDPHTPSEQFSHSLHGAVRLDLTDDMVGPAHFGQTRYRWVYDVSTTNRFHADGSLDERQTRVFSEGYGANMRAGLQWRNARERLAWAQADYHDNATRAVDPDFEFDGIDDTSDAVTIRSTALFPNLFDPAAYDTYVENDVWLAHEARSVRTENNHHPYHFTGLRYRSETAFHLPADWRITRNGAGLHFVTAYGRLQRVIDATDDGLVVVTELTMPAAEIPVEELDRFNLFLDRIIENARLYVGIARTSD